MLFVQSMSSDIFIWKKVIEPFERLSTPELSPVNNKIDEKFHKRTRVHNRKSKLLLAMCDKFFELVFERKRRTNPVPVTFLARDHGVHFSHEPPSCFKEAREVHVASLLTPKGVSTSKKVALRTSLLTPCRALLTFGAEHEVHVSARLLLLY